ncbi:MAG TPA: hypothetical protein VHS31_19270 [Tepidisphaeraceae bacterium]|jgi:uncharacterized membrane protein YwaF|nr:hypothetical protein [Tepidisphaeraceae bacterium]
MPHRSIRILRIAAIAFAMAIVLILLPLVLPRTQINKFLVAFGFLLACWSITCMINGLWDLWRER